MAQYIGNYSDFLEKEKKRTEKNRKLKKDKKFNSVHDGKEKKQ